MHASPKAQPVGVRDFTPLWLRNAVDAIRVSPTALLILFLIPFGPFLRFPALSSLREFLDTCRIKEGSP
jgi:hypothetical protein